MLYKFKEWLYIVLNLYYIIIYTAIYIINDITAIYSFYGIILGLTIFIKHKKNIIEIEEKVYIGKINLIKILTNLCITANIFIILDIFLYKVFEINLYDGNGIFIINICFLIIILISIILN
ncbi:MAG: hypothetical protein K2F59_05230, partial [Eubacteriales bacterium]|nr:hypothetical protein [Eubacteriales bacterium]